jgi:hypothetical protein
LEDATESVGPLGVPIANEDPVAHQEPIHRYQTRPPGPMVLAGPVFHPAMEARDVLRFYREFTAEAPDTLPTSSG